MATSEPPPQAPLPRYMHAICRFDVFKLFMCLQFSSSQRLGSILTVILMFINPKLFPTKSCFRLPQHVDIDVLQFITLDL